MCNPTGDDTDGPLTNGQGFQPARAGGQGGALGADRQCGQVPVGDLGDSLVGARGVEARREAPARRTRKIRGGGQGGEHGVDHWALPLM